MSNSSRWVPAKRWENFHSWAGKSKTSVSVTQLPSLTPNVATQGRWLRVGLEVAAAAAVAAAGVASRGGATHSEGGW